MLKSSSLCLYSSNLGTFRLKIEQFWAFEEISIFSNGGHLGYRTALPKLCPVIPTSNQDGHQAKNRKRGMKLKKIFSSETREPISTKLC
jgi:hypothetical protein